MERDFDISGRIAGTIGHIEGWTEAVPYDQDLYTDLGVRSVNTINILLELEDHFGIAIDDTDFMQARTIDALTVLVQRQREANRESA